MRGLRDRVALVTGAGQGIGRAIATRFAEEGARVAVNDVVEDRARDVVDAITSAGGIAVAATGDVSTEPGAAGIVAAASALGEPGILVNSAGILPARSPGEAAPQREWDRTLAVNLRGVALMCQAVLPSMRAVGDGRIVNVASTAGMVGGLEVAPDYAAAKGGILAYTKTIARQEASRGIRANCIAPSATETAMTAGFTPEQRVAVLAAIPMGRMGRPEEIAAAAVFLASDDASFITGATLPVTGGQAM